MPRKSIQFKPLDTATKDQPAGADPAAGLAALTGLFDAVRKSKETTPEFYTNNVQFEPAATDLKLRCGILDQSQVPASIKEVARITIPWQIAKVALYFFAAYVAVHEIADGMAVPVPEVLFPPAPAAPPPGGAAPDHAQQIYACLRELHSAFLDYLRRGNKGEILSWPACKDKS